MRQSRSRKTRVKLFLFFVNVSFESSGKCVLFRILTDRENTNMAIGVEGRISKSVE